LFEWTTDMEIDQGLIDEDHKRLLVIANRVLELDQPNRDAEDLKLAIRELYQYVQYHFKREESFMRESGYPELEEHHRKHQSIIQDMNNTLTRSHHMGDLLANFRDLLDKWVVRHIMVEDKKIHAFIQKQKKP